MVMTRGQSIQLVGGPHDGLWVPDNGRQEWLVPVPLPGPLMIGTLGVTDVPASYQRARYVRQTYASPDRPPRQVLLWKGVR